MVVMFTIVGLIVLGALAAGGVRADSVKYDMQRKWYITFTCGILSLQSGLRSYSVGADTYAYYLMFNQVKLTPWKTVLERLQNYYLYGNTMELKDPGYELVEKTFQLTGLGYRAWLIFIALMFFSAFGYYLYKNTSRVSDSCFAFVLYLLLFYGFYSVTGLRQTLAMACCLWAFEMVKRRKLLWFLTLVLLGSLVHKSALLFIPSYWVFQFGNPKRVLGAAILLLPLAFVGRRYFVTLFASLIGYEQYAEGFEGAGAYSYAILAITAAALIWWKADKILSDNNTLGGFVCLFAVSVAIIPSLWVDPSLMRVVQYYSVAILVIFPALLRAMDSEIKSGKLGRLEKTQADEASAMAKPGSLYLLCMLFLIAYCCVRFIGYNYQFF